VLREYAKLRDETYARRGWPVVYFFETTHGTRLNNSGVNLVFRDLSRQIGLRQRGERHGPRLHDFRHRFASVTRRMPVLSTYLGHGSVTGTYWYLSNTPGLMASAGKLLEARWKGVAS
jgi:integrase